MKQKKKKQVNNMTCLIVRLVLRMIEGQGVHINQNQDINA